MLLFSAATLVPLPLIALAAIRGGVWGLLALAFMTAMTAALDELVRRITPALPDVEFPAADRLSVAIALGHFGLLALCIGALSGDGIGALDKALVFVAAGLWFGQVSNSNAHELIHRGARPLRRLGVAVYASLLFGHHASAHVLVHHRHVGTGQDPNTARLGESFYHFARRAWIGSFRTGLAEETRRQRQAGRPRWRHPYLAYAMGAALTLALTARFAGWGGVAALLALAAFAQSQLLLSDYVQHYGLVRASAPDGRAEAVAPRHSWNSPHWFSSALMLNAPRHSDHHAHPGRRYPSLTLPEAPILPRALPVMACLALVPRQWRRVMDPRVAAERAKA